MPVKYYKEDEVKDFIRTIDVFEGVLSRMTNKTRNDVETDKDHVKTMKGRGSWYYIPHLYFKQNIQALINAHKTLQEERRKTEKHYTEPLMFLELGCGFGIYTIIARNVGFYGVGIDIDKNLIEKSENIFGNHKKYPSAGHRFILGDIMRQKSKIKKADTIYFYSPFEDEAKSVEFLNYVVSNMKVGAFVLMRTHKNVEEDLINEYEQKGILEKHEIGLYRKKKNMKKKTGDTK